jgi:hypothetical protein
LEPGDTQGNGRVRAALIDAWDTRIFNAVHQPVLISGYRGMLQRKTTIPWERRLAVNNAAEWILQLYESWGKPDKASDAPRTYPDSSAAAPGRNA